MRQVYFQRNYVTVFFDLESSLGGAVWRGFMTSEEFREAAGQCLSLITEHQLTHWLADDRGLKAIRQADQQWALEEMVPILANSSLVKMASLVPKDIFGQMAVENLHSKATGLVNFEKAFFQNEQAAMLWLLTDTPYTSITHTESTQSNRGR